MVSLGYTGLFIMCFLAATILPFSSEAVLSGLILLDYNATICIIVATIGNWLGSMSSYALGYWGDIKRIENWLRIKPERTEKFNAYAKKYGIWLGFFSWVPGIGDVISVCLGLIRTPIMPTSILIFLGKLLRYLVWAWLTIYAKG